jgi:acyl-CoA thioesterase
MSNFAEIYDLTDGFAREIGIELMEAKDGHAKMKIDINEKHRNPIGSVHGGCLFSLADTVAGVALSTTGVGCTTLSAHTTYIKAAMMDKSRVLYGEATPIRIGRKIAVYQVDITDDQGQEISRMTFEYFIMSQLPETELALGYSKK